MSYLICNWKEINKIAINRFHVCTIVVNHSCKEEKNLWKGGKNVESDDLHLKLVYFSFNHFLDLLVKRMGSILIRNVNVIILPIECLIAFYVSYCIWYRRRIHFILQLISSIYYNNWNSMSLKCSARFTFTCDTYARVVHFVFAFQVNLYILFWNK